MKVNFQISHVSIVPKSKSPFSAAARAPGTFSRIQRTFVPEKYASTTRPVFALIFASKPFAFKVSQYSEVLRHCHTIAL
jgi:hypothetical protein